MQLTDNQNYQVSLKLMLHNERGEVLALQSPPSSQMAGYHDLPGGRINESEVLLPFTTAMQREIKEELGEAVRWELTSEKPSGISLHHYTSTRYQKEIYVLWILFDARYRSGEIVLSDEHVGFVWLDLERVELTRYFAKGPLLAVQNYLS